MIKHILAALTLCLTATHAKAGDPCPIGVNIHELGVPTWLDRAEILGQLPEQKAWLGMTTRPLPQGIEITSLQAGHSISAAGFQVGDTLTRVNGVGTNAKLIDETVFFDMRPGDTLRVETTDGTTRDVRVGQIDPFVFDMFARLDRTDCSDPILEGIDPTVQTTMQPMMYDAQRRFRCDDAHIALQAVHEPWTTDVYILRGTRRIIIAMPYWGTICLPASADARDAINAVVDPYYDDRHANP